MAALGDRSVARLHAPLANHNCAGSSKASVAKQRWVAAQTLTPEPASGKAEGRERNLPAKNVVMHSSATAGVPQPAPLALRCFFGLVIAFIEQWRMTAIAADWAASGWTPRRQAGRRRLSRQSCLHFGGNLFRHSMHM